MTHPLAVDILHAIRQVIGEPKSFVALHEPSFGAYDRELVLDCIDSGFVSSVGKYVDLFEQQLAEFLGVKRVVAMVNGTAALHVSLLLIGVRPRDEVLMPSFTFVATANAAHYCGGVPHFVDVNETSMGMDVDKLDGYLLKTLAYRKGEWVNRHTGRRIAAVMPMHTFGHPVDMKPLLALAERYGIPVVEDAAEALGSRYNGSMVGSLAKVSALSFNGNKVMTTGGGGAIVTNDVDLANRAKHLTTTAKEFHRWEFRHDAIGFNYRMPNLNAALGCAQLTQMPAFIQHKRALAGRYIRAFAGLSGVCCVREPDYAESNYWLNALLLDDVLEDRRDQVLAYTNDHQVMTRPAWTPMHQLPIYADCPRMDDLSVTESLACRLVNLPSSPFLSKNESRNA